MGEIIMFKKRAMRIASVVSMLVLGVVAFSVLSSITDNAVPVSRVESAGLEVTHLTSDIIGADTHIAVRYRDEQVASDDLHKKLTNNPFSFTPQIEGKAYWQDTRTLVFEPKQPLYQKCTYYGVVNLDESDAFEFHFQTLGQQLTMLQGNFVLDDQDEQETVRFMAELEFSEPVDQALLRKAVSLKIEKQQLQYEIETIDKHHFIIRSEPMARTLGNERRLVCSIAAEPLYLAQDVEKEYGLSALDAAFSVVRLEEVKLDEFVRLQVVFSEDLAKRNYEGYVSLNPQIDYTVEVDDNCLVLSGDFKPREKYSVKLFPGIESAYGKVLDQEAEYLWEVEISDRNPAVEFLNSGMFLTSAKDKRIAFRTMNVERLRLQVKRVREENLIAFFNENSFLPGWYAFEDYNRYRFQYYGEVVTDQIVEIGQEMNKWIQSELDLSGVMTDNESALYIVQLSFDENHMLYLSDDYTYDWEISNRVYDFGRVVKHILVSDIGISAKEMADDLHVFLTDILTTDPIANALVMLKDGEGTVIDSAYTDDFGLASLSTTNEARYIEARSGNDFTIMSLGSSLLNQSIFDIGGIQKQDGVNTFIYTERGVYRPGDEINLSLIVRNEDETFPDNHPLILRLYNPLGRLMYEETVVGAEDGFYSFSFATENNALTGTWKAVADVGGRIFPHEIQVETIVPYRIRVDIDPKQDQLLPGDNRIEFVVISEYLFGAAASGLECETTAMVEPYSISFAGYNNFIFDNESIDFNKIESKPYLTSLNENGRLVLSWNIPQYGKVPSALRLRIDAEVYESGGRAVPAVKVIPMEHYESYVGIMRLENSEATIGDLVDFSVVHLDKSGEPIAESQLEYTIYHLRNYWWWEYSNQTNFRRHYKSNQATEIIDSGITTTNSEGFAQIEHRLSDYGEILIEVNDPVGGHSSGYFFRSFWWGDSPESHTPDVVNLKLDKDEYKPGETAFVSLNTPACGRALVTVEKDDQILEQRWEAISDTKSVFAIEVKEEYIPNAYISVMVYQPYAQTSNDLPLRMYGIVPLMVISEGTEIEFELDLPQEIRPEEEFTLGVQTVDKTQAQFTVAVVDEGLLDITQFKTPNPWQHFFAKQRLVTDNYDNFTDVIGLTYGYSHNLLSVGGDGYVEETTYQEDQAAANDAMRFKPISIFKGPMWTDESGHAQIDLQIPNYIGSVRVMVIGANQGRYGNAELAIPVKSPLIVLPTLPRVLGPMDKIRVPVTIFGLEDDLGEITVRIDVEGPVSIVGPHRLGIRLDEVDQMDAYFELVAADAIGTADITISAYSQEHDYQNQSHVELAVRPYNPYIYRNMEQIADRGDSVQFMIPELGIAGTESVQLTISSLRGLSINHRLNWLIRYPYGCIEQTTSAVFPQLYLPSVYPFDAEALQEIDENINAAIRSFREFQLNSGGFAYWPNGSVADLWSTNYVGHFMIEAKNKGYYVAAEMLDKWVRYQTQAARENEGNLYTRAYRLYLLALADEPILSAMNYMRESELPKMSNPEKYFLAAAYYVLGYETISRSILESAGFEVADYIEFSGTYGSTVRDQAVMLDVLTAIGDYDSGIQLYNEIARAVSSNRWYSTQTTAYSLMALSKYAEAVGKQGTKLTGTMAVGDSDPSTIEFTETVEVIPITTVGQEQLVFKNTADIPLFVSLQWEGIPRRGNIEPEQSRLYLDVSYYDEQGNAVDIRQLQQGDSIYAVYRVSQEQYDSISELALVQVLPAGWEIENLRLLDQDLPQWTEGYNLGHEEYVDIRDDRIMWFFDMDSWVDNYDFIVKLNAVTVGQFYLPPTLLEAMYNNDYKVTTEGRYVEVLSK